MLLRINGIQGRQNPNLQTFFKKTSSSVPFAGSQTTLGGAFPSFLCITKDNAHKDNIQYKGKNRETKKAYGYHPPCPADRFTTPPGGLRFSVSSA